MTTAAILATLATYCLLSFLATLLTSPVLAASLYYVSKKYDLKHRKLSMIPFVMHPYLGFMAGSRNLIILVSLAELFLIVAGFIPQRLLFFVAWFVFCTIVSLTVGKIAMLRKWQALLAFVAPAVIPILLLPLVKKEM
jgi:hypothetical protein